jgi:hypothetical protein
LAISQMPQRSIWLGAEACDKVLPVVMRFAAAGMLTQ